MSNLPPINDHEFMKLVRKQINATPPVGMTRIAQSLGVDVDDLCAWIIAYKEPKRKPYINRDSKPVPERELPQREHWSMSAADQRLANWKRAQEAAAAARASVAVEPRSPTRDEMRAARRREMAQ